MEAALDVGALARHVDATAPRGRASSTYTLATIETRLAQLVNLEDAESAREREFLTDLREREFPAPKSEAEKAVATVAAIDKRLRELEGSTDADAPRERAFLVDLRPKLLAQFPARSSYTLQNIIDRLTVLAGKTDSESFREREFLNALRQREFPEAA